MWTVELIVMALMIALNSVFAAYEIALASIGLARLDTLAHEGRHGAASALRMKHGMEGSLAVVQLGITLVGAIAAATGGAGAQESIEPLLLARGFSAGSAQFIAIAAIVLPLTIVTIIFGELVPKVFALGNREWVCLRLSPLMEWFSYCVWPAVWFLETTTSLIVRLGERSWKGRKGDSDATALQELRAIAALARTSRLIGRREEGIIVSAARLSSTTVDAIMLPINLVSYLDVSDSLAAALVVAHLDMHTRYPVTERKGDPQAFIGYVNFKDIVATLRLAPHEPSLRGILRPLATFASTATVSDCLERLIHDHNHIAVVRRPEESVVGIVTLEDILEELVGEIHDEYDRLPSHVVPAGGGWIVGGSVSLEKLREVAASELPIDAGQPSPRTLNDWVVHRLGRPARTGDTLVTKDLRVLVRRVRRQSVVEAFITRDPAAAHIH
jgi:putative hemolysin